MRKLLLVTLCLATVASVSFASVAPQMKEKVAKSYENIISAEKATRDMHVAYSTNQNVYLSGNFDTEFTAKTTLSPIAVSAYIIKQDANLAPIWNVALKGAATITTIAPDSQDGLYVAGVLADEVEFESTDGTSKTVDGMKFEGAYTTLQNASFVAHYDANGILTGINTFVPQKQDLSADLYFPDASAIYLKINNLVVLPNNEVAVSALFSGKFSQGSVNLTSGYLNVFDFMYQDLASGIVFDLDNTFTIKNVIAQLKSGDNITTQSEVKSISMTSENENLYIGSVATGAGNATIYGTDHPYTYTMDDAGNVQFGFAFSAINTASKSLATSKTWTTTTAQLFDINKVRYMKVNGDNILVAGTFIDQLPFDNTKTSTSADDIFAVSLKKADLSLNWANITAYAEGEATSTEEIFTTATPASDALMVYGYSSAKNGHALIAPLSFAFNLSSGQIEQVTAQAYTFGVAANSSDQVITAQSPTAAITGVKETIWDVTAGVENTIGDKVKVTLYPNPATEVVNFSEPVNVEVVSLQGATVATAQNVTSIDVSSLSDGLYFARINGTQAIKFIKK